MKEYTRNDLTHVIAQIQAVEESLGDIARMRLDDLAKPKGSLGRLEELAVKMFIASGGKRVKADPGRIYTIAADHGVFEEKVSFFPQEVTRQMVENFLRGKAGINVLAETSGVDLVVVDAGCLGGTYPDHPKLLQRKIAEGSANIAVGPAMSEADCLKAVMLGINLADEALNEGIMTLGTGEMGVSNTTPSTALYCAWLGLDPERITGPGGGISKERIPHKINVVKRALKANASAVAGRDPLSILSALGGYEIAALTGLILGGARNRQMVCIDGFISTAAYTMAVALCPEVGGYSVLSHASAEPGYARVVESLGRRPVLHLGMRLGEGSGAALTMFMLRAAASVYNDMETFEEAGVTDG
ncbi:nicotinate-nucleotide--dimethylbenzimidazole phosphoribosyltransferase [Maridesulfovibrio bastinii]|uniref:nicotinate-nucleotide--dimethylbenzimidazole phosphoribosyltransferase n=1 Tax=Maridesulfovibrio bastinii TaxID=47157 RepID=UPI0003FA19DF|nr:nicotinate-nucleotide--dimethylbenzimidazole phosphoribosyltransferase [Maridesulfovibrio bastinii]